jgi:hypothetical protein
MHAAGVAHGSVAASSIVFTGDGSPTLIGFGSAELFDPGSPEVVLESVPAVAADRSSLRSLAVSLLERISGGAASELVAAVAAAAPDELAELVSSRIFELGAPAPVRFEPDEATGAPRVVPISEPISEPTPVNPSRQSGALARWEPVARLLEQDVAVRLRAGFTERWRSLTAKSRRRLIAGAAGVAVLLIALAASPAAQPPSVPSPAGSTEAAGRGPAVTDDASDPELQGDDPIAAAAVLLAVRDECLRAASLLCLDGVVQPGSSAEATDRAAVSIVQGGGEPPTPITAPRLELVERLGDSALVSLGRAEAGETGPASLLLMKGEAGWRIRDYLPSVSTPSAEKTEP